MRNFVKTLRKHKHRTLSFVETRMTNATAEGLNRIIKIIKNRASGFLSLKAFTDMIYLTVGDLDIPAQIPVKFRVI
ncbi:MAG: transposase [Deltaproteobacteria bacterium]|nr:transposase [Deltaproteobacteria bacterium]